MTGTSEARRIVVGISGSSGAALARRLLEALARAGSEVHLVITEAGQQVLRHETGCEPEALARLVARVYPPGDLFSPIASGSFRAHGMVVAPCSMKTLAGIAAGYAENLLLRAADVSLKERRPLVLVARESPLSSIHLENMLRVTRAGAIVLPPVLTLYTRPRTLEEAVDQIVGKVLDCLGVDGEVRRRWGEGESGR